MMKTIELSTCESTNTEAWKIAETHSDQCFLVTTLNQTQGKGRQGRSWLMQSSENLAMSIFIPGSVFQKQNYSLLPLITGIFLHQSVCKLISTQDKNLRLKWPNDLYYNDLKLAGILCESRFRGSDPFGFVVGIGLNIIDAPTLSEIKTASLKQIFSKKDFSNFKQELIDHFSLNFLNILSKLEANPKDISQEWTKAASIEIFNQLSLRNSKNQEHVAVHIKRMCENTGRLCVEKNGQEIFLDQADTF